jgi:hypothetical protein
VANGVTNKFAFPELARTSILEGMISEDFES